jgi:hypothetical protein
MDLKEVPPTILDGSETQVVRKNHETRIETSDDISSWSGWIYAYISPKH